MNPITQESLELLKGVLSKPDIALAKSISTATGLLAYDLQAPAKNLYPFVTPIRNTMPRVGGGTGSATNWRQVNAIIGSGFDAQPERIRQERRRSPLAGGVYRSHLCSSSGLIRSFLPTYTPA